METHTSDTATPGMYCRQCGYALVGLSENRCPECGRSFDPGNPRTFRRRPLPSGVRLWLVRAGWAAALILAALLVLEAGVVAWYYPGWRAEQAAIAPILQAGGQVQWPRMGPRLPYRLLSAIQLQFLAVRVGDIELTDMNLTDAMLQPLQVLRDLQSVDIIRSTVCKDGLRHLKGGQLWYLWLEDCPLDGIGLEHLKNLPSLQLLVLLTKDHPQSVRPDYRFLADLKQVKELVVSTWIEDADLQYVGQMANLKQLQLDHERISDAGLAHLAGLTQLRVLDLENTRIAGPGLAHLRGMSQLEGLNLAFSHVDNEGLAYLKSVTRLECLELTGTRVTGAGISNLAGLPRLRVLGLGETSISDAGLASLGVLKTLEILNLQDTHVTDKGLDSLGTLPRLRELALRGTSVTAEGVNALKTRLPMLTVYWQPR